MEPLFQEGYIAARSFRTGSGHNTHYRVENTSHLWARWEDMFMGLPSSYL